MKHFAEDEINQRYSSYFPGKVNGVRDVLKMAGLKESSFNIKFLDEKEIVIKDLEKNIKKNFVNKKINFDAVKKFFD